VPWFVGGPVYGVAVATVVFVDETTGGSAAAGPFSILRFDGWDVPDVVFLEQLDSATYLDDCQFLGYRTIWDQLAVEAAEPDESKEMLRAPLRET
jgi:hypothetical protein